mmetsp:Transcript_36215/g.121292  ORF Transcript_36215/g.121292 Transcript_36215/m.121292 type:complete len:378 (-) Transcript_36215:1509-2642(-)
MGFRPQHRAPHLQLVLVLGDRRDLLLEALALADAGDEIHRLRVAERVAVHDVPVVEEHLGEGLAAGVLAEQVGESERLGDRQVGLDVVERRARPVGLLENGAAPLVERRIDAAHGALGALDLDQEDRLHEAGLSSQHRGEEHAARGGDDLSATAVDGVRVEHNVLDVEAHAADRLVAERSFPAHPLPAGDHRVLDLVEVLHALRLVHHEVRAGAVGAKAPDLLRRLLVPAELVDEHARARLRVHARRDLALLDGVREGRLRVVLAVAERQRLAVEAVVLVGRLGHDSARRLLGDGLAVADDRVGDGDRRALHEVLLQVLEADLDVKLAAARDDVLARLLHGANDERVRLCEPLEALDQLWQVVGVLRRHGDAHDGRD